MLCSYFLYRQGLLSHACISQHKNNSVSKQEKKEGWKLLFDGKDMRGGRTYKNKPTNSWEVLNGELHCKGSVTDKTDLTTDQFDNFELTLEY